ncbi:peptidase M50 [Mycobacterium sp. SMC-4]|uniref:peptidase M50 n=1 Tax=Mycobacterium sp. SMC-4 TaxID=2857059 RepID=UPI0021B45113|nr:peptidase M50 [Mycobacterium sp. SMC-4]UXA18527.1 peptidase M50 [Mycobacterium sp. SMC-4]
MDSYPIAVCRGAGRRVPRAIRELPVLDRVEDAVACRRVLVVGSNADLAAVLKHLLRTDRLDVEVAHVRRWWQARRARRAAAMRTPLIRDETGAVIVGAAYWVPPEGRTTIEGEAVVDDERLFDGRTGAVRVEPTASLPGLRATVWRGRLRPTRWVAGRAAQLGTTGARVIRDGQPGPREVRRSTFYRHTEGWARVPTGRFGPP